MIQILQETGGFVCITGLLTGLILLPVLMHFRKEPKDGKNEGE